MGQVQAIEKPETTTHVATRKKTLITVFCVLVGLGVLVQLLEDKREGDTRARPPTRRREGEPASSADTRRGGEPTSAVRRVRTFEQNEVAADDRYKGKWIEVSGQVNDIGKDILKCT